MREGEKIGGVCRGVSSSTLMYLLADNGQTRSTNLQTLQGICKSTAFSDGIAENVYVFRIKTEKPRRGNRPGFYPNYFLMKKLKGAVAPYLIED